MTRQMIRIATMVLVVAMTVTLVAVFAPLAFATGNTGRLFLEFALTVAAGARAETFATGSYIIPMDTTYQDNGMFKAYGLVRDLLTYLRERIKEVLTGAGALDFIEKPFEAERLIHLVGRATETERIARPGRRPRPGACGRRRPGS